MPNHALCLGLYVGNKKQGEGAMANDAPVWFIDPDTVAYPTEDPLVEHRGESYRWDLLTLSGAPAGTFDGVTDG